MKSLQSEQVEKDKSENAQQIKNKQGVTPNSKDSKIPVEYVVLFFTIVGTLAYMLSIGVSYGPITKGNFVRTSVKEHPLVTLLLFGTGPFSFIVITFCILRDAYQKGKLHLQGVILSIAMISFFLLTAGIPLYYIFSDEQYRDDLISIFITQDEQTARYKKAVKKMESGSVYQYAEAARIFEELGEYKDSKENGRVCWYEFGRRQYNRNNLKMLEEARDAFNHVADYRDSAEYLGKIENDIAMLVIRQKIDAAMGDKNYDDAIALMGTLANVYGINMDEGIANAQKLRIRQMEVNTFKMILSRENVTAYIYDNRQTFESNLSSLISKGQIVANRNNLIADILVEGRCYDIITHGLNDLLGENKRLFIKDKKRGNFGMPFDMLLMTLVKLAESGDQSPEFSSLISFFRNVVINDRASPFSKLTGFSALLELYDAGPEWIPICYPGDYRLKDCSIPGTVDYCVVNATKIIKDALYRESEDMLGAERFTRTYTPKEARELFSGFVPSKPLKTGFILIIDFGDTPDGLNKLRHNTTSYETKRTVDFTFLPEPTYQERIRELRGNTVRDPRHQNSASIHNPSGTPSPVTVKRQVKGDYFQVANPNNARIAIYEHYSYSYYGEYAIEGSGERVNLYLPTVDITVTDLVTGKTLLRDTVSGDPNQRYSVPSDTRGGDNFAPYDIFDRESYIVQKLNGLVE